MKHPLVNAFCRAMRLPDRRPVFQWCEDHITVDDTSPFPGRWRSANSPWIPEVLDACVTKRRTVVKCSAQSAKTISMLNVACYAVSEDPGPALWLMAAQDEAKDFLRDRVIPTFERCRPVAEQMIAVKGMTFVFGGMSFYFTGANSKSKLQSKPIRWLFLDEIRNYPPGALAMVLKRTRAFWNAHEILLSTPDLAEDDLDIEFRAGDQRVWHAKCPKCGQFQPLKFEALKWDKDERTKPGGHYNMDAVAETIRMECIACDHVWRDTPDQRRQITREGRFIAQNPNAPSHRASFHWNAMLPPWVPWRTIVEEFLNAVKAVHADPPDLEPLKVFYCETLGLSWEPSLGAVDDFGFIDDRKRDYDFGAIWPEETERFMSADKQAKGGDHYWYVIRAFGKRGASRLIGYGKVNTYEELETIRDENKVPLKNAMIDSGFKASEVYRWCARTGWKPFKGDNADYYLHTLLDPKTNQAATVRRLWQKATVDPHIGMARPGMVSRQLTLYRFAGDTTKDFLTEFMQGAIGEWTLPSTVGADYVRQLTAERRISREDTRGRTVYEWRQMHPDNHLLDCECMILVAAVIKGLVPSGVVRQSKVAVEKA